MSIVNLTPEQIADIYCDALEEERSIYKHIREVTTLDQEDDAEISRINMPNFAASGVKTIALHSSFAEWKSGHWQAMKGMASELVNLGYEVVFLHHSLPPTDELPDIGRYIILPKTYGANREECISTVKYIEGVCLENNIDAVIFNSYVDWRKYLHLMSFKRVRSTRTGKPIQCLLQFHSSFISRELYTLGSTWLASNAPCVKTFDALLVESDVDLKFWSEFNRRVFFRPLPMPFDVTSMEPNTLDTSNVLSLGRISKAKNQIEVIQAMAIVVSQIPDAKLIIAGEGASAYTHDCEKAAIELGIADNVIFTGHVVGEEKERLIRSASIAVSASRFEGYPLALAEMKSHGIPLVMYDIPNLTIENGGMENGSIIVKQHDVAALAEGILSLLQDSDFHAQMGARAHAHMQRIYGFDYQAFWMNILNSSYVPEPCADPDGDLQKRIYQLIFQSYEVASEKLEEERRSFQKRLEESPNGIDINAKNFQAVQKPIQRDKASSHQQRIEHATVKISAAAKSVADVVVDFQKPYRTKPHVVCSIYSSSEDVEIAEMTCSAIFVKNNQFTIRVFNNGKIARNPAVTYIAVGV